MSAVQCKMVRATLGWDVRDLARLVGVSPDTVARLEQGDAGLRERTVDAMRHVLEQAGIEFLNGDGARLRASQPAD